jgi:predicted anti-sigma-YlaC factor YlaD
MCCTNPAGENDVCPVHLEMDYFVNQTVRVLRTHQKEHYRQTRRRQRKLIRMKGDPPDRCQALSGEPEKMGKTKPTRLVAFYDPKESWLCFPHFFRLPRESAPGKRSGSATDRLSLASWRLGALAVDIEVTSATFLSYTSRHLNVCQNVEGAVQYFAVGRQSEVLIKLGVLPIHRTRVSMGIMILISLVLLPGCSVRRLAVNSLGDALASGTSAYAKDDDPELVKQAIPFGLKTIEGLLDESPRNRGLLLAAASGFTQYSYAFVQCEADYIEDADLEQATAMRVRAGKLYRRAMDYGFRGLEAAHPGFQTDLRKEPKSAVARMQKKDVPLLYWTAASWAARISLNKENPELSADIPLTEAMMERALALDENFGDGAIHDFFIAYEGSRQGTAGGSVEQARRHFDFAMRISEGKRVGPLVTYAEDVDVGAQDRSEFEKMLNQALAFDPDTEPSERLPNLVAQKRARWLLSQINTLFLE